MTSTPTSLTPRVPLLLGLCGLVSLLAASVMLMTGGPAASDPTGASLAQLVGNKGSIDVSDAPYAGNPRNDPKVRCDVAVRFFDFEEGTEVTSVVFERPGAGTPLLTGDAFTLGAPVGGSDGLNAEKQYTLDLAVTQDDAGRSIPVKVSAFVSHDGKDGWKSKVFKCLASEQPTEATTEPTEPTTTEPTDAGSSDVGGVVTDQPSEPGEGGDVGGVQDDGGKVPTVIDAGATGWTTRDLWGSGLAGAGIALLVAALAMSAAAGRATE